MQSNLTTLQLIGLCVNAKQKTVQMHTTVKCSNAL